VDIRVRPIENGAMQFTLVDRSRGAVRKLVVPAGEKVDKSKLKDLVDEIKGLPRLSEKP